MRLDLLHVVVVHASSTAAAAAAVRVFRLVEGAQMPLPLEGTCTIRTRRRFHVTPATLVTRFAHFSLSLSLSRSLCVYSLNSKRDSLTASVFYI